MNFRKKVEVHWRKKYLKQLTGLSRKPSMNFRENTWETLIIIYQISQNKSIAYQNKDDTKKT